MPKTNFSNGLIVSNAITLDEDSITLLDTVWDDLRVPITSTRLGGSKDPDFVKVLDNGDSSQGLFTYLFDQTVEEEVYFTIQIPHKWKYETDLHAHVHWVPTVNGSADQKVSWGLEYSVQQINGVFGNSAIIYNNETVNLANPLIAKTHYLTEIGTISMTGISSVSAMILCRLFRDATGAGKTDNYANDAALLEFDLHFEIDRIGSITEYA